MQCVSCGSDNPQNARYCLICGSIMGGIATAVPGGFGPCRVQQVEIVSDDATSYAERLTCRILGGVGWLVVSCGTFLIAFGWLSLIGASYYDDELLHLNMIGYGLVAYAVSATLFAVRAFVKTPR